MKKHENSISILEGSLLKSIFKLGIPIALNSLVQTLYNLADTFWLGKMGREALSAPIISFFILFLVISVGLGLSMAGTTLVAQYKGAGKEEDARRATGNLLFFITVISVLFSAAGVIWDRQLLELLKTPPDAFEMTRSYFRIMMMGMPLAFPIFAYQSVMNGYGDTLTPLKITLVSAAVNVVLDPLLIFGWLGFPRLGVEGAALTSVVSRGLASGIGIYLLFSGKKGLRLNWAHLKPDWKRVPLMVKIALPSTIGTAGASLGFIVLMNIVNRFGTPVVSAYGIGMRVVQFFMMPALGISAAVTTIVGQNLGAGNIARARASVQKGAWLMIAVILPPCLLMGFFGKWLTMFFIPTDPLVHQIGQVMFYVVAPSVLIYSVAQVLTGAFQGSGFTVPVMVTHICNIWLFRLPAVYFLAMVLFKGPGNMKAVTGIWVGMLFSNVASYILLQVWYLKGDWAKARTEEKQKVGG